MANDLRRAYAESKRRDAERAKAQRAATAYGVFPHSIDRKPTGRGYVVRPIDATTGQAHDQRNYGGMRPLRVYKVRSAAERAADKMGGY